MSIAHVKEKIKQHIPKEYSFYRYHYHHVIIGLIVTFFLLGGAIAGVLYQLATIPLPIFTALDSQGKSLGLTPFEEPNLLADTIVEWASKAAVVAYTFDFYNYKKQIEVARPYFTSGGWEDYLSSVSNLLSTIVEKQLTVSGVVAGSPVISNQGPIPGRGYAWRVQIPFLVSYSTGEAKAQPIIKYFYVMITIIRIPTTTNPQGIGIDQFVMVSK